MPVSSDDERDTPHPISVGSALPFFELNTLDGQQVRYADLWQRKNVVLVCLPSSLTTADVEYANELSRQAAAFASYSAVCVLTRDEVRGLRAPAAAVADRWGEVQYLASSAALPASEVLLDALDYIQRRCPECEGEWR